MWVTGLGGVPESAFVEEISGQVGLEATRMQTILIYAVVPGTLGVVTSSLTALGEEIGWRGLLVPDLAQLTGFTKAALICGAVWAVWHVPAMVFAD